MSLSEEHRPLLLAVIETLIPIQPLPSPVHEEVLAKVESRLGEPALASFAELLPRWLEALNMEAATVFSCDLVGMHPSTRDELFDRIEADNIRTDWQLGVDPHDFFDQVVNLIADVHLGPAKEDEGETGAV